MPCSENSGTNTIWSSSPCQPPLLGVCRPHSSRLVGRVTPGVKESMLGGRLRLSPNNPRHSAQLPSYTETRRCNAGERVSAFAVTCKAATYDSISAFRPRGWRESGVQGGARGGFGGRGGGRGGAVGRYRRQEEA